jgi:hypothetical protein
MSAIDSTLPASRVFLTLKDMRWELIPTGKLTFPETKEAKRVSGGMSLVDLEAGIAKADSDAWFAWMFVSIRRVHPTLTEAELMGAIGDTSVVDLIAGLEREAPEAATPDPLGSAGPEPLNGPGGPPNENGSSETIPELSTLETSGEPT